MSERKTKFVRLFRNALAAFGLLAGVCVAQPALGFDSEPWRNKNRALVIDAYEMNIIDWEKMAGNKRVSGFISKASDGLPEVFDCRGKHNGDSLAHC